MANRIVTILCAASFAGATLVSADALAQSADAWKWQASIYAYLPTIGGTTTFPSDGGSGVSVNADKILSNLNFAFMGSLEASNGRWGGFTDLVYMDVSASKSGTRDFSIGGSPLPGSVAANLDYSLKGTAWTLAGTYRTVATPGTTLDVLAGARLLDITQKLGWDISGDIASLPLPGRTGSSEASLKNWDGIVGLKGRTAFGNGKWFVPYYVDVGTGNSELTWQAMAGVGYSFGWGDVVAAWRYLDYRMKSGNPVEGLTFNGPAIAAVFRW